MSETASIDDFLAGSLRAVRARTPAHWALGAEAEWKRVWARIEYHGLAFLLHSQWALLNKWPKPLLDRMAEEARLIALWESTHQNVVTEVVAALDDSDIECILMKGTALAYSLHDEPAARRRGDTDLLVRPHDQDRTRVILQQLGWYRKKDPHGLYYQEGWLHDSAGFFVHSIDLHWEPTDRPVLQTLLPTNEFFAEKRPLSRLHKAAFRPSLAVMVLHATINQKWHALHGYHSESGRLASKRRLIWSIDLDLICKSMTARDWKKLVVHCTANGVGALVAEALRGMQSDLESTLPEDHLKKLEAQPLEPSLLTYFANPDSLSQFWIDLKRADSLQKKSRLIVTRAFPPREHLLEKYPAATSWPTALLQGRMLVETAGRALQKVTAR